MNLSSLSSRRLANVLLLLIFVVLIAKQWSNSGDTYVSTILICLTGLLTVSILGCSLKRFGRRKRPKYRGHIELAGIDTLEAKLAELGFARGAQPITKGIVFASIVFHFSIIGIVIGLSLSLLFGFYGKILLTEGQLLSQSPSSYVQDKKGPLASYPAGDYQLAIGSTDVKFVPGKAEPSELGAQLIVMRQHQIIANAMISPNESFDYKGINIAYDDYGLAPHIIVCNSKGEQTFNSYVNLSWATQDDVLYYGEDNLDIKDQDINIHVQLYPDAKFTQEGKLTTLSNDVLAPALWLTVKQKGKLIFTGLVIMGQTAKCSNGMTIVSPDIRRWVALLIKKDPGYYVMIGSGVVAAISLLLAVAFPPFSMRLEGDRLVWATDKYPHLFVDKLRDKLGLNEEGTGC